MGGLATNISAQIPRFLRLFGIDRAVAYTLLGRLWIVLAGPVTLAVLAAFLTREEQGFYFTFTSLLGLQLVFELGLHQVMIQFASHEKAHLEWTVEGTLSGNEIAKSRLASLLRRGLIWYGVVSIIMLLLILPAGFLFFTNTANKAGNWQVPWLWFVSASAANLAISPLLAILEGCGRVAEVAILRTVQNIGGYILFWLLLWQDWRLFAAPVPWIVSLLIGLYWLFTHRRAMILDLLKTKHPSAVINWWLEVWPMQWKVALSWISTYLTFQLFTPLIFLYQGPIAAGQVGISLNILSAILSTALAWVNTKSAPFGMLVAKRDFVTLDKIFSQSLRQSIFVFVAISSVFWFGILYINSITHDFSQRLLSPLPLGLLILTNLVIHSLFAQAVYMRAYKQEPFIWFSVGIGILVALAAFILAAPFGTTGVLSAYLVIVLILGIVQTSVFLRIRRRWQHDLLEG